MTQTTPNPTTYSKNNEAGNSSFTEDQRDARINAASTTRNPLQFRDIKDRAAATFAKASRITNNPKFQALPAERQTAILGRYYDTYVHPAYTRAGFAAPAKDLWVREIPHEAAGKGTTDVASFYLNANARSVAITGAATISNFGQMSKGITYAGIKFTGQAAKTLTGLSNFFAAPSATQEQSSRIDSAEDSARHLADKVSNSIFDSPNFWLQTHPSQGWQDKVNTFVGENLLTLPLYEAIGAGRVATAAATADLLPTAGRLSSLTAKLAESPTGKFVARRLGEATDAYIGAIVQNVPVHERMNAMLGFMGFGAAVEGLGAVALPSGLLIKKMTASIVAMGGRIFQHSVTDEAAQELEHGINSTKEELQKHLSNDPVKTNLVVGEKLTLTAMAKQMFPEKKYWRDLSHGSPNSQREQVIRARDAMTQEAIRELPLHLPNDAKAGIEAQIKKQSQESPLFASNAKKLEELSAKILGKNKFTVAEATQEVQASKLEQLTGIKNTQATLAKLISRKAAKLSMAQTKAAEVGQKNFASLKTATIAHFNNLTKKLSEEHGYVAVAGLKGKVETTKMLTKWLADMDEDDFLSELQSQTGFDKMYDFEHNPEHILLWANHFRKELPAPFRTRLAEELKDRDKTGTQKQWDTASANLERHMDRLSYVNPSISKRGGDRIKIFNSTKIKDWADKTKWQPMLLEDMENEEFEKLMPTLKRYPEVQKQAASTLKTLQQARRLSKTPQQDKAITEMIRLMDKKRLMKRAKSVADRGSENESHTDMIERLDKELIARKTKQKQGRGRDDD